VQKIGKMLNNEAQPDKKYNRLIKSSSVGCRADLVRGPETQNI
jgi:hypothetical protein